MNEAEKKAHIAQLWNKARRFNNKLRFQARLQKMTESNLKEMMIDDIQEDDEEEGQQQEEGGQQAGQAWLLRLARSGVGHRRCAASPSATAGRSTLPFSSVCALRPGAANKHTSAKLSRRRP